MLLGLALLPARSGVAAPESGGGPVPASRCPEPARLDFPPGPASGASASAPAGAMTLFATPIAGGMNSFGQTVINYVDDDAASPAAADWNCGAVTYDGHRGTDIELTDFFQMDEGVPVLAAAPGVVVYTHDGEFDRNTSYNAAAVPNSVILLHADGSRSHYLNLRRNSVRVQNDQEVATGDTLAMVGSSGYSSGPHLHFETGDGGLVDPFHGPCQAAPSRWLAQGTYVLDLPFQLMTHGLTTIPISWPVVLEKPPSKTHVSSGKTVYSWIRVRNAQKSDVFTWKFYANGTLWAQYGYSPTGTYASSWWYLNWNLNSTNYGSWRIDVLRNNAVIAQQFFSYDANSNQPPTLPNRTVMAPTGYEFTDEFRGADFDGSIHRYELVAPPRNGTLRMFGGRARKFTYQSLAGYFGRDSFQVRPVDDENVPGATATYVFDLVSSTAVGGGSADAGLRVTGIAPNPIRDVAEIACALPRAGRVTLEVFDPNGARVRTLGSGDRAPGRWIARWNTRDDSGREVPAGIYFLRLRDGRASVTRRVVVAR